MEKKQMNDPTLDGQKSFDFGKIPDFPPDYPIPPILPTVGEHPRVWVKDADVKMIRAHLCDESNLVCLEKIEKSADLEADCLLPETDEQYSFSCPFIGTVESLAFKYLISGEKAYGYRAIACAKNYLATVKVDKYNDLPRYHASGVMSIMAEVYDWCYGLLSEKDKEDIVAGVINKIATAYEMGVPPSGMGAIVGHSTGSTLLRSWLAFGIAIYDDYPHIYNNVVGRIFRDFIAAPDWYYRSGANFQGSAYGQGKTIVNLLSEMLVYKMSGKYMYKSKFRDTAYTFLHYIRPDWQSLRIGDDFWQRNRSYTLYETGDLAFLAGSLYEDAYLIEWAKNLTSNFASVDWRRDQLLITPVTFVLFNKPWLSTSVKDIYSIPLTNFNGSPTGAIIARSAWNDKNAWMTYTKVGEAYAGNHEHKDAGSFQVYYKGILAMTSSCYEYSGLKETRYGSLLDFGYNKQTISKNSLLIYNLEKENTDREDKWLYSGGQRLDCRSAGNTLESWLSQPISRQGKTLAHDFVYDDGRLMAAYVSGDITGAYDEETVDAVCRQTISISTDNVKHPLLFATFDRVISKNESFKKTYLLHVPEEPTVEDNVIITTNTKGENNGKLIDTVLLPKGCKIDTVGGKGREFEVNGENLWTATENDPSIQEIGWGRVEISTVGNLDDSFLNVMYVADADADSEYIPVAHISTPTHEGAASFGNIILFSKDPSKPITEKTKLTASGDGVHNYYVTGFASGEWSVCVNGVTVCKVKVQDGSDLVSFRADCGEIEISPA
jgi:heparin/heparan-sulfate lyase